MKNIKTTISLMLLLFSSFGFAQIVNIPDANFKTALINGSGVSHTESIDYTYNEYIDFALLFFNPAFTNNTVDLNNDGEIQVSEAEMITGLNLNNLNINSLEGIESFVNLEFLSFAQNSITLFDPSNLTLLEHVNCSYNNIIDLDFSLNANLVLTFFVGNQTLETVNLKNGSNDNFTFTPSELSNLLFACLDDGQELFNFDTIAQFESPLAHVSSYCTFVPGGDFNSITGTSTFDLDNNGCDTSDLVFPFLKLNIEDGTETGANFTDNSGEYNFFTQDGNFTVTPEFENPTFFNSTPIDTTINFPDTNNNITTQDFCISPNGIHSDLEIVMAPTLPARPGFDAEYLITYRNKGNQTLSGDFSFNYDDSVLDYILATVIPTTQNTGVITWDYIDLLPFETRSVYVTLNVNSPQETPAINIDDQLGFSAIINPIVGDEIPSDNVFDYKQIVVGAFDPNDITCIEGDIVEPSQIGEYLHYIINFENTGNFPAQNIVVATEIDPNMFNISTLRILSSSHDAYVKVTGDTVEIIFESIFLSSGGHGNILLKVKTNDSVLEDGTVTKNAEIFFDYNFPIETNNANTTFSELSLSNPEFETDATVSLYPNPIKSILNITAKNSIKSVSVFDVQGRIIQNSIVNDKELKIDLSQRAKGVYFVKIITAKGLSIEKIIKD